MPAVQQTTPIAPINVAAKEPSANASGNAKPTAVAAKPVIVKPAAQTNTPPAGNPPMLFAIQLSVASNSRCSRACRSSSARRVRRTPISEPNSANNVSNSVSSKPVPVETVLLPTSETS